MKNAFVNRLNIFFYYSAGFDIREGFKPFLFGEWSRQRLNKTQQTQAKSTGAVEYTGCIFAQE